MENQPPPTNTKKVMDAKEAVNALSNLRPQHLTEALMVNAIPERRAKRAQLFAQ